MTKEQEILNLIRKIIPNSQKYLHDDAAVIENNLIVTTDTIVENTHFTLKNYTPFEIGWKALAVNLSDIAAIGGKPLYALVSLSLPKNIVRAGLAPAPLSGWVKRLYRGILSCAKKYKTQIIGGNLAKSKEINITITIIGKIVVRAGLAPAQIGRRANAKPGDFVFCTGTFGNAKKMPIPQIELGQKIVRACFKHAPALMDSSDGLADCLIQIVNESKVKIVIEENKIPRQKSSLTQALYGGEDYQLVGTVSVNDCRKLKKLKGISIIGRVETGKGAYLMKKNDSLVKLDVKKTYEHFS